MIMLDPESRQWLDDHIEAFVDGSLSPQDRERFQALAAGHNEVQHALDVAGRIATSLRSIPDEACPDFVTRNVMARVRKDVRASAWARIESFFMGLRITYLKPVLAVATVVLIVVSTTQFGNSKQKSEAEVTQALTDVKWTLAYLSDVGKNAGTTVKANVIEEKMVQPMSRSFNVLSEN